MRTRLKITIFLCGHRHDLYGSMVVVVVQQPLLDGKSMKEKKSKGIYKSIRDVLQDIQQTQYTCINANNRMDYLLEFYILLQFYI